EGQSGARTFPRVRRGPRGPPTPSPRAGTLGPQLVGRDPREAPAGAHPRHGHGGGRCDRARSYWQTITWFAAIQAGAGSTRSRRGQGDQFARRALGSPRHSAVLPAVDGVGHRYARLVVHSRLSVLGITQSGLPARWHIGVLQIDSPAPSSHYILLYSSPIRGLIASMATPSYVHG